jgi:ActR/RegA family two-component response regulator
MKTDNNTITILHIDSNAEYTKTVYKSLVSSSRGTISSIAATTLEQALRYLSVILFDAMVVDLKLPDCIGTEIIHRLKNLHPETPVIVLTDIADEPTIARAIVQGVQNYILKNNFSGYLMTDLLNRVVRRGRFSERYNALPGLFHHQGRYARQIVSTINTGILIVGKKNQILFANPHAAKLLSTDVQKLIGSDFSHPADSRNPGEFELPQNDQSAITVEMRKVEMEIEKEPVSLISLNDITHQKTAEKDTEMLAKIQAENPNPFLRIDGKGTIVYANEPGVTLMNQWGCAFFSTLPPFLIGPVKTCVRNRHKRVFEAACGKKTYLFNIVPLRKDAHIHLYGTDITRLKRVENTLRESVNRYQTPGQE